MMKCTMKWESNGKEVPVIWEKYDHQFPIFSPYGEFRCISLYYEKLMGKPMHFPYQEVYRRMGIVWGKITHAMAKVWVPISQVHPIRRVLLHFPVLWETDGETHAFPLWRSMPKDGNLMRKKHPYYGKSMSINFVAFPRTMWNLWGNPCTSHMMTWVNFFLWLTLRFVSRVLWPWVFCSNPS